MSPLVVSNKYYVTIGCFKHILCHRWLYQINSMSPLVVSNKYYVTVGLINSIQ